MIDIKNNKELKYDPFIQITHPNQFVTIIIDDSKDKMTKVGRLVEKEQDKHDKINRNEIIEWLILNAVMAVLYIIASICFLIGIGLLVQLISKHY